MALGRALAQLSRRDGRRRPAADRGRERRPGQRVRPDASGSTAGLLRTDQGERQRHRDEPRDAEAGVRASLHHEGSTRRAGPDEGLPDRRREPRPDRRLLRGRRRRHHGQGASAGIGRCCCASEADRTQVPHREGRGSPRGRGRNGREADGGTDPHQGRLPSDRHGHGTDRARGSAAHRPAGGRAADRRGRRGAARRRPSRPRAGAAAGPADPLHLRPQPCRARSAGDGRRRSEEHLHREAFQRPRPAEDGANAARHPLRSRYAADPPSSSSGASSASSPTGSPTTFETLPSIRSTRVDPSVWIAYPPDLPRHSPNRTYSSLAA